MRFKAILIDPPWEYRVWTAKGSHKSASAHYTTQDVNWISNLDLLSVAAEDCCLFCWVTWPNLPEGLASIGKWGFEYKTLAFDWVKLTASGTPRIGLGYYTRSNSEPCLLATVGRVKRLDKGVGQIVECAIGPHSEKPLEVYRRIEALVEGPYLEIFARPYGELYQNLNRWTRIGNEITGRDISEDLRLLAEAPDSPQAVSPAEILAPTAELSLW